MDSGSVNLVTDLGFVLEDKGDIAAVPIVQDAEADGS
jgi:hypothetical protein